MAALKDLTAKRDAEGKYPADGQEQIRKANEDFTRIKTEMEAERLADNLAKEQALMEFHQRAANTSTPGHRQKAAKTPKYLR